MVGDGIVWFTGGTGTVNWAQNTGHTISLGNSSGESVAINPVQNGGTMVSGKTAADNNKAVSYRGIENLWGNLTSMVDGANYNNYEVFIADHDFDFTVYSGRYKSVGSVLTTGGTYIKDIIFNGADFTFLPSAGGGNSSSYLHDEYLNGALSSSGHLRYGGNSSRGLAAGIFRLIVFSNDGNSRLLNGRLCYIP
jgi:hypothetical protein